MCVGYQNSVYAGKDESKMLGILGQAYYGKPIEPPIPREEVEKIEISKKAKENFMQKFERKE